MKKKETGKAKANTTKKSMNDRRKQAMIKALKLTLGNVQEACAQIKINRSTHYDWYKNDEGYREQVDEVREEIFDFVESKIYKLIKQENVAMIIFFAKTRMKERGYIERQEIQVGQDNVFVVKNNQDAVQKVLDVVHNHGRKKHG